MKTLSFTTLLLPSLLAAAAPLRAASPAVVSAYNDTIRPLFADYCNKCHSAEKHKGNLDLERFLSFDVIRQEPEVWEKVREQISDGEMPPKDKPQLTPEQKTQVMGWISQALDEIGLETAGDPGPVVLRRLSNAEYAWTLRDLTGIPSLDPGREFPVDGAAGEGFTNAGAALVMSPTLLTKYLDAAREVASHAVLLPHGIAFSSKTTQRDWTEEKLAAIREFYARYTASSGATQVNLQGIQFETNGGGRLPLEQYLAALLTSREAIAAGTQSPAAAAAAQGLSGKYAGILWNALMQPDPGMLLGPIQQMFQTGKPENAAAIAAAIGQWQNALWRFTTVGHIGKRDGPKAWQVPVNPLVPRQEIRLKLPPPQPDGNILLHLSTTDAGDGNGGDIAVWENARFVAPGRPDLLLRDVRRTAATLTQLRDKLASTTEACLNAAAGATALPDKNAAAALALKHGLDPALFQAWLSYLGIGTGEAVITGYLTRKSESSQNYDFVKGWTGDDALSVVANSSDQHVRVPGNVKPHSVVVHPSPTVRAAVGWRSPVDGTISIAASVQHAHPECGNGITWALEVRRGNTRQRLADGVSEGDRQITAGPFENIAIHSGDLVSLIVGPRDGNHSCDLTAVNLAITHHAQAGQQQWDLAQDVSPDILAGNPHADRLNHAGIWHFYGEPESGAVPGTVIPAGSLLAKWQAAAAESRPALAAELQALLQGPVLAGDSPDALLQRQLTSLSGPLLAAAAAGAVSEAGTTREGPGLDPALFGRHPDGAQLEASSLCVQAPSLITAVIPASLVEGCEFVTTASVLPGSAGEGSVQMQILTGARPATAPAPGTAQERSNKSTWSDGEQPLQFNAPILVADNSAARKRIESQMDAFRSLFSAALCYTRIVPVDEVVTLTLFFREDDHLRRLMLDEAEAARLDQLWDELHFVSQDALTLVDAFEQLWQFATQDADPSAFEPMREPIKQRAAAFRKRMEETEPGHVAAAVDFARRAWRRPLTREESDGLNALYAKLRSQELAHDAAIRMMLIRILTTPAFLYRSEKPELGKGSAPVQPHELAVRLSYFLWSSQPDAELSALADSGRLLEPGVLAAQTRRMLQHGSIRRMATEFGCQWLHVRDIDTLDEKSERHFPTFNALRSAMKEETVLFFTDLLQHDRPVLSLLDADHTFLNEALATHYAIAGIKGDAWQRVEGVKASGRGGLLGFAATLAKQSGASRTSPILRGNWFCETLLGERLPRPPKGVPTLPEEAPQGLTERQLIEKHSSDKNCSGCHARIDPFGYALEGFDAIGRFRTMDAAGLPVNTAVKLPNGTEFAGLDGLRQYLLGPRREDFLRQFCRKLLGYALGRSVMLSDKPLIDQMISRLAANDYRIGSAIDLIVSSPQFREVRRKGE